MATKSYLLNVHYLKEPCSKHRPKQLGYCAWGEWADKMYKQGKRQTQCKVCGRWYFKSEM